MAKNSSRVYSTDTGRSCPRCEKPLALCSCREDAARAAAHRNGDGIVRLRRESKGRKGKGVTLIDGLDLPPDQLNALAKALKARCGSGGTVKKGVVEIQGEHRELLQDELRARGFQVRLAGG